MMPDGPHSTDAAVDQLTAAERRVRARAALLVLAGDLDDLGIRSRLVDDSGAVLRCWDGCRQGGSVQVACTRRSDGRLQFCYHPSGAELGDAEAVLQPGVASDVARVIAVALSIRRPL